MDRSDVDPPRRKRIRLDSPYYTGQGTQVFITVAVADREPLFLQHALADDCLACLRDQTQQDNMLVHTYCFMPDHLHLLLEVGGDIHMVDFMRNFKTRSTRVAWKHNISGAFWQRSYYDHILRTPADMRKCIRYILMNPVRARLVEEWRAYPLSGSLTMTLEDDSVWDHR